MPARVKAFLIHLGISLFIALLTLLLVFGLWYPAPLHEAVGVTRLFLVLLAVDLVLGPMLTLLVYSPGKKSLVFDLSVIALLQISALAYGLWAVAEGRPAWLVFNVDRFDLVRALDVDTRKLDEAELQYRHPSWTGPKWVAAVLPAEAEGKSDVTLEAVMSGVDLPQRPNFYRPLHSETASIQRRLMPVAELRRFNTDEQVHAVLAEWPDADGFLPLMAPVKPMTVLMRKQSGQVLAVVELNPWAE